jgi:hypothetical protein
MVVQQMLEFLRDVFDKFVGNFVLGSGTVLQGNTTLVVTHGLGNATYAVVASPKLNPGGNWWITGKTSTQFTINLAAAAPVGGIPFDWLVKGA